MDTKFDTMSNQSETIVFVNHSTLLPRIRGYAFLREVNCEKMLPPRLTNMQAKQIAANV